MSLPNNLQTVKKNREFRRAHVPPKCKAFIHKSRHVLFQFAIDVRRRMPKTALFTNTVMTLEIRTPRGQRGSKRNNKSPHLIRPSRFRRKTISSAHLIVDERMLHHPVSAACINCVGARFCGQFDFCCWRTLESVFGILLCTFLVFALQKIILFRLLYDRNDRNNGANEETD